MMFSESGLVGVGREWFQEAVRPVRAWRLPSAYRLSQHHQDTFSSPGTCHYVNDNLISTGAISFAGLPRLESSTYGMTVATAFEIKYRRNTVALLKTQHSADITERRIASIIMGKFPEGQTTVKKIAEQEQASMESLTQKEKGGYTVRTLHGHGRRPPRPRQLMRSVSLSSSMTSAEPLPMRRMRSSATTSPTSPPTSARTTSRSLTMRVLH